MEDKLNNTIGSESLPSIINNPFSTNCVTEIRVSFRKGWFNDKWSAHGHVDFQNGKTKGAQSFEGSTFDEVVAQIRIFIEELHKTK